MSKLHLRQPQFTHNACGRFTKHSGRIQKFREIDDLKYIYKKELDKACFAHDAAYSDRKDIAKRTISDSILEERNNEITAKDLKEELRQPVIKNSKDGRSMLG